MVRNIEQKVKGRVIKRNCATSNASNADIPEDIQIEILSRLSFKSLSRGKCVSKHWNDTLTIQAFLLKHSRSYDKHSKLAFVVKSSVWGKRSIISFELNDDNTPKTETVTVAKPKTTAPLIKGQDVYFTDLPKCDLVNRDFGYSESFYMSNICNGLICLFRPYSTFVSLLNIKTRDFIQLPPIIITMKSMSVFRCSYALGFDPVQQVFKVLNISYGRRSNDTSIIKAAILTVGSKYWNPVDNENLSSSVTENLPEWTATNSLCLDGVIYLLRKKLFSNVIVAFDFNREAFRDYELVMTPITQSTLGRRYYLTCLKQCPTLFIWNAQSDLTDDVVQWTLFNHKNPNATWKRRNFTNNYSTDNAHFATIAGGSTLLRFWELINNSEYSWYFFYDLEKFAIE
ncbi:putative F-box protein At1g47730 [Silene latifolia]|uniref:putative F-box protein At1g47730 n=1 Tax=Silene latifolia TaxID=37657 RepID=UPI003D77549A